MLQHLWTGPYSNAAVDIIQGSKSVEVRPIGVTKARSVTAGSGSIKRTWHICLAMECPEEVSPALLRYVALANDGISGILALVKR